MDRLEWRPFYWPNGYLKYMEMHEIRDDSRAPLSFEDLQNALGELVLNEIHLTSPSLQLEDALSLPGILIVEDSLRNSSQMLLGDSIPIGNLFTDNRYFETLLGLISESGTELEYYEIYYSWFISVDALVEGGGN